MRQTRVSANNPEFQKWTAEQRAKFPPKENESRGYRAARLLCGTVYNPHGLTTEQLMEQVRGG